MNWAYAFTKCDGEDKVLEVVLEGMWWLVVVDDILVKDEEVGSLE